MATLASFGAGFEENRGQARAPWRFFRRASDLQVALLPGGIRLALESARPGERPAVLDVKPVGGHPDAVPVGEGPPSSRTSYLHGPGAQWVRGAPVYDRVRYRAVYPGVDLVCREDCGRFEYDFEVRPDGDPERIRLALAGSETVRIDEAGALVAVTPAGELRQPPPSVFQTIGGRRHPIPAGWRLEPVDPRKPDAEPQVSFRLGKYDRSHLLIIDPVIERSLTFGDGYFTDLRLAMGPDGSLYVAGSARSESLPGSGGAFQQLKGNGDAFVVRLTADATQVLATTYLGGGGLDTASGVAVAPDGKVWIAGTVGPLDSDEELPGVDPAASFQAKYGGGDTDGFAACLSQDLHTVTWATYLGAGGNDGASGIAMSQDGAVYVTGYISDPGPRAHLPTSGAPHPRYLGGQTDAFLARFRPSLDPGFLTYLGGRDSDRGLSVAVQSDDHGDRVWVCGVTTRSDVDNNRHGLVGPADALLYRCTFERSSPVPSEVQQRWLRGEGYEIAYDVALDRTGAAYIVGATNSAGLQLSTGADRSTPRRRRATTRGFEAFAARIDSRWRLGPPKLLGGAVYDAAYAVAVGPQGVFLTGTTGSIVDKPRANPDLGFPVKANAVQGVRAGEISAFIAQLNRKTLELEFSSYLGGRSVRVPTEYPPEWTGDSGHDLALDPEGNPWVVGRTLSPSFPQTQWLADEDGKHGTVFVTKWTGFARAGDDPYPRMVTPLNSGAPLYLLQVPQAPGSAGFRLFNPLHRPLTFHLGSLGAPFRLKTRQSSWTLQSQESRSILVTFKPETPTQSQTQVRVSNLVVRVEQDGLAPVIRNLVIESILPVQRR